MGIPEIMTSLNALVTQIEDTMLQGKVAAKIRELERALESMQDKRSIIRELTRKGNAYWKGDTSYCVNCVESGEPRTLVQPDKYSGKGECPACKSTYAEVFPHETPSAPFVVGLPRRDPFAGL